MGSRHHDLVGGRVSSEDDLCPRGCLSLHEAGLSAIELSERCCLSAQPIASCLLSDFLVLGFLVNIPGGWPCART